MTFIKFYFKILIANFILNYLKLRKAMRTIARVLILILCGGCFYYSPEADPYKIEIPLEETLTKPEPQRVSLILEVTDADTKERIPDVKLVILGTPLPPYTLEKGEAKLVIPAGRYRFKFSAKNYKEVIKEINVFQNTSLTFYLEKER